MFLNRVKALSDLLNDEQLDLVVIDDPINLFYLTGQTLSTGRLYVTAKGDAQLFVDGRYISQCQRLSPFPVTLISENSQVDYLRKHPFSKERKLGFDSVRTSYSSYLSLKELLTPLELTLCPLENPLQMIRAIKDDAEIEATREATLLGSKGYDYALSLLKEGTSERQVATELEIFWKRHGGEKLAFESIIAFGSNSAMPHYRAGDAILKSGQIVLIDIGIRYKRYHSDMTRTVFFGPPNPKLREIYFIVKEAQERALLLCKPGTLIGDLDSAARDYIASQGYGNEFSHGLGHGVGLEVHEFPSIKNISSHKNLPLKAGMVITVEPGIYLEGLGGVRIENMALITPSGFEDLTKRSTDLIIL